MFRSIAGPRRSTLGYILSVSYAYIECLERSSTISSSSISNDSIATSPSWDESAFTSVSSDNDLFSIRLGHSSPGLSWPAKNRRYHNHLATSHTIGDGATSYGSPLTAPSAHLDGNLDSPSRPAPALGKAYGYPCPFCAELNVHAGANRESDLKRHFKNFHNTNAGWVCSIRICGLVFDWQAAYEMHMKKEDHIGTQLSANEAKFLLPTQVVFACGFVQCKRIFEAPDGDNTERAVSDYFKHVARHIATGATIGDWAYSTRIRNLLRQSRVQATWKGGPSKDIRNQLTWQLHNSSVLRKKLECGDVEDVETLVGVAISLGSPPYSEPNSPQPKLPHGFTMPTLDKMVDNWKAQSSGVNAGFVQFPSNSSMNSWSATMTMGTILPQGGPSYAFTGQELYPGSSHQGDVNWPLSGNKLQNDNPQPQPQYPAPEHLEVPASQPYGYGSYDPLDVNRDHPLAQWPGIESLGRFPSMEKVVAGITNRPKTPSKRFLSMAKKSFESLRGRKNSRSEGDSEITGNTPLMPTVAPTHHGYGSSSQISLNSSSSQLPDEQTRY